MSANALNALHERSLPSLFSSPPRRDEIEGAGAPNYFFTNPPGARSVARDKHKPMPRLFLSLPPHSVAWEGATRARRLFLSLPPRSVAGEGREGGPERIYAQLPPLTVIAGPFPAIARNMPLRELSRGSPNPTDPRPCSHSQPNGGGKTETSPRGLSKVLSQKRKVQPPHRQDCEKKQAHRLRVRPHPRAAPKIFPRTEPGSRWMWNAFHTLSGGPGL